MKDALDDFKRLLKDPREESFIRNGIESIIFPDPFVVDKDFDALVAEIQKGTHCTIRAYGRGRVTLKREAFNSSIAYLIGKPIREDATNNTAPNKRFYSVTGIDKKKYKNYKLSHVWDKMSKNPYAFCALWNMCLTPFFIDPFTGHETKGSLTDNFTKALLLLMLSISWNTVLRHSCRSWSIIVIGFDEGSWGKL